MHYIYIYMYVCVCVCFPILLTLWIITQEYFDKVGPQVAQLLGGHVSESSAENPDLAHLITTVTLFSLQFLRVEPHLAKRTLFDPVLNLLRFLGREDQKHTPPENLMQPSPTLLTEAITSLERLLNVIECGRFNVERLDVDGFFLYSRGLCELFVFFRFFFTPTCCMCESVSVCVCVCVFSSLVLHTLLCALPSLLVDLLPGLFHVFSYCHQCKMGFAVRVRQVICALLKRSPSHAAARFLTDLLLSEGEPRPADPLPQAAQQQQCRRLSLAGDATDDAPWALWRTAVEPNAVDAQTVFALFEPSREVVQQEEPTHAMEGEEFMMQLDPKIRALMKSPLHKLIGDLFVQLLEEFVTRPKSK
jgi:hypothetical protein